jgi:hypothetical protein
LNVHTKALAEFVVIFQWVEHKYRQIGWFILDPEQKNWPPMQLRTETNKDLTNKVTDLFIKLTQTYGFPNSIERADDFERLRSEFHALRKFRNQLLHSTYIEVGTRDDVFSYLRSNPKISIDPETGEIIYDQEDISEEVVNKTLKKYADAVFR